MTYQDLEKTIEKNNPHADFALIKKAYLYAEKAHTEQKRQSGENYIQHPLGTAKILAEIKADSATLAAGLLHDVVDDTPITIRELEKEFGAEIAFLVNGVTKLGKIKYRGIERQVENLRKMFLAMAEDIRVILIKLADRLHNIKTLEPLPLEKRKRIALETLEIYSPLAHRLGIRQISGLLEDLSFPFAYPNQYWWLINNVKEKYKQRKHYLDKITPLVEKMLRKEKIKVIEINSRAKHYWSLYKKLKKFDMDMSKIYDLVALRIIVKNVEECYAALGIIHKKWRPLPGRIKDYMALPKPNGYKSLHTTVACEKGIIVEFQIRTPEMHSQAEYGIAAHWAYQEKGKPLKGVLADEKELQWVNQLREWQKEITASSPEEFLKSLKIDFFQDRIFVLTPKGEVIDLPEGSTPIDFAYFIHTGIGHRCHGAKIDGKLVPLHTRLKSGDVIEIIKSKEEKPSRSWLEFVKTAQARSKIKTWLNNKMKEEGTLDTPALVSLKQVTPTIAPKIQKPKEKKESKQTSNSCWIEIGGQAKIAFRLAKCCDPQQGRPICAYISKQKGIAIHDANCPQIKNVPQDRIIPADWQK